MIKLPDHLHKTFAVKIGDFECSAVIRFFSCMGFTAKNTSGVLMDFSILNIESSSGDAGLR